MGGKHDTHVVDQKDIFIELFISPKNSVPLTIVKRAASWNLNLLMMGNTNNSPIEYNTFVKVFKIAYSTGPI